MRVSTARQLKGYGLKVQLQECTAWLDYKIGKGKYVADVYTDGGVSGKLTQRPDLTALNTEIAAKAVDLVVFGKLDRIGRTMRDIHRWVYDTTDREVRIATADGRIDSDDEMFGIQLSLLAYMAELEHTMILDRTMGGREEKLAEGGWPGGVAPFWIQLPGKDSKDGPSLREEGVKLLEIAARLLVDDGMNAEEAARGLNSLGFTTARGLPWTGANLIRVFRQTALDGYVIYRNTERVSGSSLRRGPDGEPLYGDTVRLPLPIPLSPERVQQVRVALARRSFSKSTERGYLLTGRVHGLCGSTCVGAYRESRKRATYRCNGHRDADPCSCQEVLAGPLEDTVWTEIEKVLQDGEKLNRLAEEWLGDVPQRAQSYRDRIADLDLKIEQSRKMRKRRLVALAATLASDGDGEAQSDVEIHAAIDELRAEIKEKERKLQEMRDQTVEWLEEVEEQEDKTREVLRIAKEMSPQLGELPIEKKRDLVELLDVRVHVTSEVPGALRNKGCPFEGWFLEYKQLVPPPLTDEQWQMVEHHLPSPKKRTRVVPPRVAFEASLYKVRHGLMWKDLPVQVTQGLRPQSIYQRALEYLKTGVWEQAVRSLGAYAGTPVPPLYALPDLHITGAFDPQTCTPPDGTVCSQHAGPGDDDESDEPGDTACACDDTTNGGARVHVSSSSWRTRACSTPTTGRSCGRCSGPVRTAA
ncbi:recombinase family protein [Streptomyces sp. BH055]|uniref:recombinase family protein n=1 Tax=Streptomyces sp. BH055 TaxID=3401173 RepID=UPI003BB6F594